MSDVEAFGGRFAVAERVGLMPLMKFAKTAQRGVDADDMSGLVALYDLLEQCIAEDDWPRFEEAATKARADGEMLMRVVTKAIEAISARPTGRLSDSSDGPTAIEPRSATAPASSEPLRLIRDLESQGRADKAEFIVMAERARASAV